MPDSQPSRSNFSGYKRALKTRLAVRISDQLSRILITAGGIGTIAAVSLVCVFLVWEVVPMFLPPKTHQLASHAIDDQQSEPPLAVRMDEYVTLSWACYPSGLLRTYELKSGELLNEQQLFDSSHKPTAWSFANDSGEFALGLDNGNVQLGRVSFQSSFLTFNDSSPISPQLQKLEVGQHASYDGGIVELTPEHQYRKIKLEAQLDDTLDTGSPSRIVLIDQSRSTSGEVFATLSDDQVLRIRTLRRTKNLLTGQTTVRLAGGELKVDAVAEHGSPRWLLLSGLGDNVFLLWSDGFLLRIDTRNLAKPIPVEQLDLTPEPGVELTAATLLLGKTSLATGDQLGNLRIWFRVKPAPVAYTTDDARYPLMPVEELPPQPQEFNLADRMRSPSSQQLPANLPYSADQLRLIDVADGSVMVVGHQLPSIEQAVTALDSSARSRMLVAGFADGSVRAYFVTTDRLLTQTNAPQPAAVNQLSFSPKDDAILALVGDSMSLWRLDVPHPEPTLTSMFKPIWYEGHTHPQDVWQSSSGTDDFEAKFGMVPLVFGTIKATIYSMLFGAPLALLAAIYSSEFMHPRVKARVKPTIEMMASLPSVVLGFLAALIVAPAVENFIPQVLACFIMVPFSFLLGGYLWQLMPTTVMVRMDKFKLLPLTLILPLGLALGWFLGRPVELWLFAGDFKIWLDGQIGSGTGAWMFILLPLSALLMALSMGRWINPVIRARTGSMNRQNFAMLELIKFLTLALLTLLFAWALSWALNAVGWDPRGSYVDTYVQRNALVVGFIMGFAIIPIIYTISEDALAAVPEHLRGASLGAGATPWQTAVRVILPTAMSGLFSAMMIGLGRAVGETMIVLMAAGNTPVMDWNIFNGFRTLSANIAVELPEAPVTSTHYRMLFLAALVLFAMTFAVNTVAEIIRLRFRRRAYQL